LTIPKKRGGVRGGRLGGERGGVNTITKSRLGMTGKGGKNFRREGRVCGLHDEAKQANLIGLDFRNSKGKDQKNRKKLKGLKYGRGKRSKTYRGL